MKCPLCKRHISYPTQRQFLAWYYRIVFGHSEKETAELMGVTPRAVRSLLQRFGKIWPELLSVPSKKDPSFCQFDENIDSTKHHF